MNVNPYFMKDFAEAARFYNLKHCTRIISILRETDLKNKGLGAVIWRKVNCSQKWCTKFCMWTA